MNAVQRSGFNSEIVQAKRHITSGNLGAGFFHLERAHVIGQEHLIPHVKSHWLMFQVEFRRRRFAAAIGQVIRIVLGALGSAVGVVPTGNTGGTNVSMFRRMPIESELQNIIDGRAPGEDAQGPICKR